MPIAVLGTLLLLLAGMLTACSDDSGGGTAEPTSTGEASATPVDLASLDGTAYVSTRVEGRELVPGSEIQLLFEDDVMSVSAGCNTMFGAYEMTGTTLAWVSEPASSMMACEPELADQDIWLSELFTTGVDATSGVRSWRSRATESPSSWRAPPR